ncbi:hypothetical protein AAFF_G00047080 [Aldrovandia affinis]|uniref:Podocalyxin n=1 Tax=Aldrovandia affinis TaxID=143900 RepID=A0AAD7WEN8_9TELE|nr:hypothetical protein AAFF_G00047080 [Aldrovandia affinis]
MRIIFALLLLGFFYIRGTSGNLTMTKPSTTESKPASITSTPDPSTNTTIDSPTSQTTQDPSIIAKALPSIATTSSGAVDTKTPAVDTISTRPSPTPTIAFFITKATTVNQITESQSTLTPTSQSTLTPQSTTSLITSTVSKLITTSMPETDTKGAVLPALPSTDTSMATSHSALKSTSFPRSPITQNSTGIPEISQTLHITNGVSTVAASQTALGPSRDETTIDRATPPKTPNTTEKDVKDVIFQVEKGQTKEQDTVFFKVCEELMNSMLANKCTLDIHTVNGKQIIKSGSVQVDPTVLKKIQEKHELVEPQKSTILIAILCSCAAVLVLITIIIGYIYTTRHRQSYRKNQQHLTEELQTVENGYHDNPTLEVMEVQPEMQEKKAAPNGEFNDSWIVPFDNLAKEDMPDEEDTHL